MHIVLDEQKFIPKVLPVKYLEQTRPAAIKRPKKVTSSFQIIDMTAAIQFRKGFVLFCLVVVSYIVLAVYKRDVARGFCDTLVRSNRHAQSIDHFKEALMKSEQNWKPIENTVAVGREFFHYLANQLRETAYPGVDNYTQYVVTRLQLKPLQGVKPLRPDYGPVFNNVQSFPCLIEIRPCREDTVPGLPSIFVAIISAPSYFEKRDIIRQTWLRDLQNKSSSGSLVNLVGFAFVVGRTSDWNTQLKIESESSTYGDILQIDMVDVYYNQTLKVVALVNWINDHCSRLDFVLKVDDDVYVNTRNLITVVKSLDPAEQSVYGTASDGVVQRDGKFKISAEVWPWSKYPVYCMGAAVLMPGSVMQLLLAACQTTPYFLFDDTYLIGLCTSKAGLAVRVSDRFLAGYANHIPEPCYVQDSITWLTDSVDHFNESHWATADFYKNVTPCIIEGLDGTNQTTDPNKVIEFSFSRSQS